MISQIQIILFSYRNKNLKEIIDNLYSTSTLKSFSICIFDQNNYHRIDSFKEYPNLEYRYSPWDYIHSPCKFKNEILSSTESEFSLIISDDVAFLPGWDVSLLNFTKDKDVVVSGNTLAKLSYKDAYTIEKEQSKHNEFMLSQFIDRNLIFGRTKTLRKVDYPVNVKYFGEEELLSIALMNAGVDIYSAPRSLYEDLHNRIIEKSYTTFSKYHGYNDLSRVINLESSSKFLSFHGLQKGYLRAIPDLLNDVSYSPNEKNEFIIGGKKFVQDIEGF